MMRIKSGLSGPFLLLLLSSTVSGLGSVVSKKYGYIQEHFTWLEAQSYCRNSFYYTDLATIYTKSDSDGMYLKQYHAWTGLHKGTSSVSNLWIWSDGTYYHYYSNFFYAWARYPPDSASCAVIYHNTQMFYDTSCEEYFFFICDKRTGGNDHHYTFIPQSKTWSEALKYCTENTDYSDLANFYDYNLQSTVIPYDFPVWTGLHRDGETWKWSRGLSEYRTWAPQEPGNNGDCVTIFSLNKTMATQNCSARFPFICLRDNLVLVKENKTWEEALEHCRALSSPYQSNLVYDLVSVQPVDYSNVMNKVMEASTEKVWVGLRFLAGQWLWVNGADMSYSDLPLCPLEGQHCGVLSQNDTGSLETADCLEKRNFMCYST